MNNVSPTVNRHILIIDNNEDTHKLFHALLGRKEEGGIGQDFQKTQRILFGGMNLSSSLNELNDFDIDSAYQGEEGLKMVQLALEEGRPYVMAFVEMRMSPGWDGIETIQRIWQEYPELQIVISTNYTDYSWLRIVSELGLTDKLFIIEKPFNTSEIYKLVCLMVKRWHQAHQTEQKQDELKNNIPKKRVNITINKKCLMVYLLMNVMACSSPVWRGIYIFVSILRSRLYVGSINLCTQSGYVAYM